MSIERFRDYTENLITAAALGAFAFTGITAVNSDFGAEFRIAVHRTTSDEFNDYFLTLGETAQSVYMQEVSDDFEKEEGWFGGLAVVSLLTFTQGTRLARKRRDGRLLNNV